MKDELVLILRYRDLNPPELGHTIRGHEDIQRSQGYVWWAWWKKQTEEVPLDLWSRLVERIAQRALPRVLLLDSGQRLLHQARLEGLEFDPAGTAIPAPEGGNRTPAYYGGESYSAWFRLAAIEPAPDGELRLLAYARVPHDDLVAVDADTFVGRRIAGIGQLLEFGNVTYWVATPAAAHAEVASSPRHIVRLQPLAPKTLIHCRSRRILQISDLHLSAEHHAFQMSGGDAYRRTLATAVGQACHSSPPGLVFVTGDLTWTGSAEEFDLAFSCLNDLRATLGLGREHFVIVPGNHDLQWTTAQATKDRFEREGKPEVAKDVALANYRSFFERWYGTPANEHLSIGRRCFLNGGPTLDVLGLNSSMLLQIEGSFQGIGCVTEAAFEDAVKTMGWGGDPRATREAQRRLLLVHHHLLPVVYAERPGDAAAGFGLALDADYQLRMCTRHGVDLVLHGHQHEPFVGFTQRELVHGASLRGDRALLVIGSGSTAVRDPHLGPIRQRCFNLLELDDERVTLDLYATYEKPDVFSRASALEAEWGKPWRQKALA